ncbi:helix-turn-helix transcriptional regulator [Nonomuraea sp. NPDC050783]|uniref:helix-turn-helix transcriptional regulator n=1 Tax=Nonomuraea sp. NPDC050783 TaxID=3154634 RepID=UPI003465E97D
MCYPAWGQALAAAQRLHDLARLRRVRDRIDREYARPLDVQALARDAGTPAGQLSHRFRQAYGKSPYAYLMDRRVERAAALLRLTHLSVPEISAAVGGPSPAAFGTRFTELVGMPPAAYRQAAGPVGNREAPPAGLTLAS